MIVKDIAQFILKGKFKTLTKNPKQKPMRSSGEWPESWEPLQVKWLKEYELMTKLCLLAWKGWDCERNHMMSKEKKSVITSCV